MANKILPPLPPSDNNSMQSNYFDGYYKRSARSFWDDNEVSHNEVKQDMKCDHKFIRKGSETVCEKCHFGLIGSVEIRDGKLFHQNEPIGI